MIKAISPPLEPHSWPPAMFSLSFLTPSLFSVRVLSVSLCDLSTWKKWFTLCIYEDIIWLIENTASTSFALNRTCVYLCPQQKVWIESCHSSFALNFGAVRSPGKSNFSRVTGVLNTAMMPVHVGKRFINSSDFKEWQKGRTFPGLLRSFDSVSRWSPIAPFSFWGPFIRLALIVWPPKYNNTIITYVLRRFS